MYRKLGLVLSLTLVVLGIAMIVMTLVRGQGWLGVILGPMFIAAGAGRLYVFQVTAGKPQPSTDDDEQDGEEEKEEEK